MSLRRRSGGGGGGGGTSGGAAPRRSTPHSMLHSMAAGAGSARPTGRETRSLAASRGRGSAGLGSTCVGRDGAGSQGRPRPTTRSSERQGADGGGAGGGGAAAARRRASPTNAQVCCTRQPTPMQPDCLPPSASRPSRPACRLAPASRPPHPSPSLASCPHRSCPPAPLPPSPTARHHHTPPSPPPPLPHPRSSQVWLAHTGELLPAVGIATANVVRAASRCRAALTELSKELMLNAHPPSILGQFLSRFLGNS